MFVTHILAFANSCFKSWNEFYFLDRSGQVKQVTAIIFQWKIHVCNELQRSLQLFCHISLIQICNTTWEKAGDMPSVVTAIIEAGRNWTIDYSAGQACDVVIKVFTCIKAAWNRVRNMFATVLKPGFHLQQTLRPRHKKQSDYVIEQSSFRSITLFWPKIGRCRGRNCLYGNQALQPLRRLGLRLTQCGSVYSGNTNFSLQLFNISQRWVEFFRKNVDCNCFFCKHRSE